MKKLLVSLLCGLLVLSMFGCGKKEEPTADTYGTTLEAQFEAEAKSSSDVLAIADKLAANEVLDFGCGAMEVEPGFLNGFDGEVTGFEKGAVVLPMIGTIPFVAYVFEAKDANALLDALKTQANPRWNICTEAAETVYTTSGNLVFFTMCPSPEE